MDKVSPWGTYALTGLAWLAVKLAELGFGHGKGKRILHKIFQSSNTGTVADVVKFGIKWRFDFCDNTTDYKALFASEYDRREIKALARAGANGVIVDIGANIGFYSLQLAKTGATVLALEPNPRACERLLYNIRLNAMDNVIVLPLGAGEEGEDVLSLGDLGSGSTVISSAMPNTVKIRTVPLLDILNGQHIGKIDIEGAEDLALVPFFRDAPRKMWPACISIEHCHRKHWGTDIINLLLESGYRQTLKTRANIVLHKRVN